MKGANLLKQHPPFSIWVTIQRQLIQNADTIPQNYTVISGKMVFSFSLL
jgi:hypothetical protein